MIDIIFHDETGMGSAFPAQADGFEKADGSGEIHYYRLFDGVGILLLRLEMETYTEMRTQVGVLEVNFCINGRFETSFSMRDRVLLKPGDMAISCYDGVHGSISESRFPLGYYEGICLEVNSEAASGWIAQHAPAFHVDFSALKQNLLDSKWYMVGSAGSRCEHVFRELYESASYADHTVLQLKVLELLLYLDALELPKDAEKPYFYKSQVEKVKAIHRLLTGELERHYTIAELSERFSVPATASSRFMGSPSTPICVISAWTRPRFCSSRSLKWEWQRSPAG